MNNKLIFWVALNDTNNLIRKEISIFTKETGIKVETIEIPWGKMWEYIITSIKENYKPDVIQIGNSWISILTNINYLEDATNLINNKDLIFNISTYIKKKYYAVPWFLDIALLFYNREKYTGQSTELLNPISISNNKKNILIFGGKKENILIQYLSSFIWQSGSDYIYKNKFNLLNEQTYNGIKSFFDLINENADKKYLINKYGDTLVDFFINEKGTFTMANSWAIQTFIKQYNKEKKFSATNFNCIPKIKCNFIGGSCLGITKSSKMLKESRELIKFLISVSSQKRYLSKIGMIPVLKNVFNNSITDFLYPKTIKSAIENGRTYPSVPYWGSFEQIAIDFIYNTLKSIKQNRYSHIKLKNNLKKINNQLNFLINLWNRN